MGNKMISKEIIESYLADYSAIEKMFYAYHKWSKKENTIDDMLIKYQFFDRNAASFIRDKEKEEAIYPKKVLELDNIRLDLYTGSTETARQNVKRKMTEKEQIHFQHKDYFDTDKNVFINKHLRFTPGEFHDHEFIEMCYVYRGQVSHVFRQKKGAQEKTEVLKQGNLVIIPPGMQHKISIYDDSLMINIVVNKYTFEKTFLGDIPENSLLYHFFSQILFSQETGTYVVFRGGKEEILCDKLLDLMVAYLNDDSYSSRICDHYLSIFFLELLGQCEDITLSSHMGKEGELIARVLLYIRNHYNEISLEDVAREFHYSKTYLNRIFKGHMDTTILKYIQETRLEQSTVLLCNTRLSVEDIATHVGYEDTSYYIELFKKKYQKTPLQYRHEHR